MQKEHGFVSNVASGASAATRASVTAVSEVAVTHVAARRGARVSLDGVARATFGAELPSTPRAIEVGGVMIVWPGPEQWLIIQPRQSDSDASVQLAGTFSGLASVVDVSDSRTI